MMHIIILEKLIGKFLCINSILIKKFCNIWFTKKKLSLVIQIPSPKHSKLYGNQFQAQVCYKKRKLKKIHQSAWKMQIIYRFLTNFVKHTVAEIY